MTDSFGNNLFHVACQNGNKRIAKQAAKFGVDMNAQNIKGNTGLHFLLAYGYAETAEYFVFFWLGVVYRRRTIQHPKNR